MHSVKRSRSITYDNIPGRSWRRRKFSSANVPPPLYMLSEPVPSPFTKSPPCAMKPRMILWKHEFKYPLC